MMKTTFTHILIANLSLSWMQLPSMLKFEKVPNGTDLLQREESQIIAN